LWPTPQARDWKQGGGQGKRTSPNLNSAVLMWPTPRYSGAHATGGGEMGTYRRTPSQEHGGHGRYLQSEVVEAEIAAGRLDPATLPKKGERRPGGQLNPTWVEWLMGFPLGWTALPPSATPSSRRSPSGSAAASSRGRR
jgi:hypothetical protein